jgi:hypothetical protein
MVVKVTCDGVTYASYSWCQDHQHGSQDKNPYLKTNFFDWNYNSEEVCVNLTQKYTYGLDCHESNIWCETRVREAVWQVEAMLDYTESSSSGTIREIIICKLLAEHI